MAELSLVSERRKCIDGHLGQGWERQDGRIRSSKWNIAEIIEVTTGAIVRQDLDAITDTDWRQLRGSADREQVTAFRSRLVDAAEYDIHALEVLH